MMPGPDNDLLLALALFVATLLFSRFCARKATMVSDLHVAGEKPKGDHYTQERNPEVHGGPT